MKQKLIIVDKKIIFFILLSKMKRFMLSNTWIESVKRFLCERKIKILKK